MECRLEGWERLKKALNEFAIKFHRDINDAIAQHVISKSVDRIRKGEVKPPTSKFTLSLRRKPGGKTLQDTGQLMKSLTYQLEGDGVIKIGSEGVPYAKVHQFGATIKAKKAQKLCIPATKETRKLTLTRNVREALEELKKQGWKIWFTDKAIMGRKGKKESVLFYRKEEVEIPARTFVYMTEGDWEEITEMVKGWLKG